MKSVVDRVAHRFPVAVDVVDISTDSDLEASYGVDIPVLLIDGKKAAKYRISEDQLLKMLRARS
jgi:Glutaredoxin-like domain (DUF836)